MKSLKNHRRPRTTKTCRRRSSGIATTRGNSSSSVAAVPLVVFAAPTEIGCLGPARTEAEALSLAAWLAYTE